MCLTQQNIRNWKLASEAWKVVQEVHGIIIGSGDLVDACKADTMPASDSAPRIDDAEALV
jgi:hypothetical protein